MKNIFKTILVTVASVSLLTGCIKETFPLEGAATSNQLAQSAAGMAASVDGLVAQMYQPYYFYGSSVQQEFDMSYSGILITYARMLNDVVNNSSTEGYDWWTGYAGSYGYSMKDNTYRMVIPFMTLYKIIKSANDIIGPLAQLEEMNAETVEFNPLRYREDPSYTVKDTRLYGIMKEAIIRDKVDENIIFFNCDIFTIGYITFFYNTFLNHF